METQHLFSVAADQVRDLAVRCSGCEYVEQRKAQFVQCPPAIQFAAGKTMNGGNGAHLAVRGTTAFVKSYATHGSEPLLLRAALRANELINDVAAEFDGHVASAQVFLAAHEELSE